MSRILFIGLGNMGQPIATRLVAAGHDVTVADTEDAKVAALVAHGARGTSSIREAAGDADLVFTVLPADRHLRSVAFGDDGLVEGISAGTTFVDFSTVSPHSFEEVASAVEARGGYAFDAALGSGCDAAAAGTLTLMTGGDAALVEQHREVLNAFSTNVIHCGSRGAGKAIKLANNLVSAVSMIMNAEAMLLATKAGADPNKLVEVMQGTIAYNRSATTLFPREVFTRNFHFGFSLELMRKDVALAASLAEETDTPLSLGRLVLDTMTRACESGLANEDVLRIVEVLESSAGAVLEAPGHTKS